MSYFVINICPFEMENVLTLDCAISGSDVYIP